MPTESDPSIAPTLNRADAANRDTAFDETLGAEAGPRESTASLPGYQLAGLIGRGGMGEVVRGHDQEIGRDVAIKRLRGTPSNPDAVSRFLREAKIQARLEHPAIVPVHAIGRDSDGHPYFTMKRITGTTLADVLARPGTPRHKLLRTLVDACRAMDFAHSRGVIHRDLKPANIMLGDFGEVYVLDWGLARVLGDTETATVADGDISLDGSTQAGAMLGTPGYMAPEQIEDAHGVSPAADVYALGSIMFEILAGASLHQRGSVFTTTLGGTDLSPAARTPARNIAPELDALCVAALARDPAKRPTSRELAERLEGFLDGDRDLEGRLRIAALELEDAQAAYESGDPARRAEAMQAAGRALALNPKSWQAADLITRLMLEPPVEQPAALREQLMHSEIEAQRRQGRSAAASFAAVLAFLGLAAWNGIHDWPMLGLITAFTIMLAWIAYVVTRRELSRREILFVTLGNATFVALFSRMFGSLLLVPGVGCVMMLSLTSYPQNIDRARYVILAFGISWIAPVILEWTGVVAPTWRVVEGGIVSTSPIVNVGGTATVGLMVFAHIMTIIVFGLFANRLARSRRDAQRQVEIQAWHLKQLLPTAP